MSLKIHERHEPVTKADIEIREAIVEAVKHHELTFAELTGLLASILSSYAKYEVYERHGNSETPGGLASGD